MKPNLMEDRPAFELAMRNRAYPLSLKYDPEWVFRNSLGPNCLWLAERIAPVLRLKRGMRVLDLGCGTAITSIFLARELNVEVWAADLWINPNENQERITEAGLSDRVFPIRAEARQLPFAANFFDAVVSLDAFHYFGTDIRYLSYLSQFLKPGGRVGILAPGNLADPDHPDATPLPPSIESQLGADWYTFRSPEWWRLHWSRTLGIEVELAEAIEGAPDFWDRYIAATEAYCKRASEHDSNKQMRESDAGRTLTFCQVVARRNSDAAIDLGPGEYASRIA